VGLGGIYPARARVNFGIEGWEELKCSPEILRKIKSFPRDLKTREQIEELVDLIETAIKEINEPK
jgi:predicted RND superfamily exporter protein